MELVKRNYCLKDLIQGKSAHTFNYETKGKKVLLLHFLLSFRHFAKPKLCKILMGLIPPLRGPQYSHSLKL